jgi:hypothetical protein
MQPIFASIKNINQHLGSDLSFKKIHAMVYSILQVWGKG